MVNGMTEIYTRVQSCGPYSSKTSLQGWEQSGFTRVVLLGAIARHTPVYTEECTR